MKFSELLLCSATGIFAFDFANQLNAGSVPKQLYNKTVSVGWGEASRNKRVSDGATVSGNGKFDRIIYISSAGRFFSRGNFSGGGGGGRNEQGPEEGSKGISFQGNSLTAAWAARGGGGVARRLSVNFDPAFGSCTASLSAGKAGTGVYTGFDGAPYEMIEIIPSAVSCSIKEGNPFGAQ